MMNNIAKRRMRNKRKIKEILCFEKKELPDKIK